MNPQCSRGYAGDSLWYKERAGGKDEMLNKLQTGDMEETSRRFILKI